MAGVSFKELIEGFYLSLLKAKADMRGYDIVPLPYNSSQQVILMRPCNGWTVINQGSNSVTVNGTIVLAQGQFIAVGGNEGEVYTGILNLQFATNGDPNNNVVVLQKFYTDGKSKYDKARI